MPDTLNLRLPSGQAADFEAEALPHSRDLYRAALRLLRDAATARDAVQETYLLAWMSFARCVRGTNCKAWLFQILINVVRHERRNWFKGLTVRNRVSLAGGAVTTPLRLHTRLLADDEILAALDRLPAPFREVLLLVDVEEFSYKEASAVLKVPLGTVMSRLSRARRILRHRLGAVARSYGIGPADLVLP